MTFDLFVLWLLFEPTPAVEASAANGEALNPGTQIRGYSPKTSGFT